VAAQQLGLDNVTGDSPSTGAGISGTCLRSGPTNA